MVSESSRITVTITRFGSAVTATFQHHRRGLSQSDIFQETVGLRALVTLGKGQEEEKLEQQDEEEPEEPLEPDETVRAGFNDGGEVLLVDPLQRLEDQPHEHQNDGRVDVALVESAVVEIAGDDDQNDAQNSRNHAHIGVSGVTPGPRHYLYIFFFRKYLAAMGMKTTIEAWSIWKKLIGMKVKQMSCRVLPIVLSKLAIENRKELNRNI